MSKRIIKKVAVLGSGVMGSRIACHFAGIGLQVLLLDIAPSGSVEGGEPAQRNKIVNDALTAAIKSNPSPVYTKDVVRRIRTGNFTSNMKDIADCDWVIEVVVERLDIKQSVFTEVEKYRKPGTLITSNTSGIPIHMMAEGRSEDFRRHFCGTHFFNPPRYLRLLEIIPTPYTDPEIVDFLMHYGDLYLGKTTVLCKDTPAFIANRIGVFGMMVIMNAMEKLQLNTDEIDVLTGPIIGRPKSATFRTADVVGIDTLVKVAKGVYDNCPGDEAREQFLIPDWLDKMAANNWLGDKTGQGFFKKIKGAGGEKEILTLNLQTLEYGPRQKSRFATLETAKPIDDLRTRLKVLCAGTDKAGEFYRLFHYNLFAYISHRVPEITDELYRIDDAMMAGFGWEIGAFESWDVLGVAKTTEAMKAAGYKVASWIEEMLAAGAASFYKVENGKRLYYDIGSRSYKAMPGGAAFIIMKNFSGETIWKNSACRTYHLGDDVLGLEWYTKMGSIGGEVLEGIQKSIALAEDKYKGLVIANEGANFSAGANVGMIFMLALEQDYDEIDLAVRMFQNTIMRCRYSAIPVVVAPHGLALGGACEMSLHADKVIAAAETYTGLVEVGIGVIPGGAGTKEFVLRAADEMHPGEVDTIGITCPAGYMAKEKAQVCIHTLQKWGFDVMVGKTLGSDSTNYFSGTDEERLNELQAMLDDHTINAILCGRGGYGVSRIIDQLDFSIFRKKPKWIIGYSDITVLHAHIYSNFRIASIHSPMAAAFNNGEYGNVYIASLHNAIIGKKADYKCAIFPFNKPGTASGELIGGNLSLLTHLIGTSSDIKTKNKILFLEDIGEMIYNTDRMLYQLKRAGKLDELAGLIIGGFTDVRDTDRPFGKTIEEVINDIVKEYDYPVCFNFPVSHTRENYALKIGATYQLNVGGKLVRLVESGRHPD